MRQIPDGCPAVDADADDQYIIPDTDAHVAVHQKPVTTEHACDFHIQHAGHDLVEAGCQPDIIHRNHPLASSITIIR